MRMHLRAVGVEEPGDFYIKVAVTVVGEEQSLRATLPLVIAGADPVRIHVPPVVFRLRVNVRIAVDLRGGRLENPAFQPFGKAEHVGRADNAGFDGLDRIALVMNGRRGTCEIVDFINLNVQREVDVVADQLEMPVVEQLLYIGPGA